MWRRQHLNLRMVRIFSADHYSHPVRVGLPIAWRRNSYFRPLSPGCNLLMSHNEHIDAGKLHPSAHALVVVIVRRIYRLQSPLGAVRQVIPTKLSNFFGVEELRQSTTKAITRAYAQRRLRSSLGCLDLI